MASELRVNTLKDAAGANSVAMEYVANGSAKAWFRVYYSSGVPTERDSFNVASYTDTATGRTTVNYTNAMGNANYVVNGTNHSNNDSNILIGSITTTNHLFNNYDGGYTDTEFGGTVHGDLA